MDLNKSLKLLDNEPAENFRCQSCSYLIPSYNAQFGICPFCEQYSDKTDIALKSNKAVYQIIYNLQQNIVAGKFDEALRLYDLLFDATKSIGAIYSKGVFQNFLADIEFAKRDYATPNGYMEENSVHSKAALAHFSSAKASFFKAISLLDSNLQASSDIFLIYTKFLCEVKVSKMGEAKKSLVQLNANSRDSPITAYANMVYYAMINQKDQEKYFEKAVSFGIPNALYYYSNFLSQKNNLNGAKRLLNKLSKRIEMTPAKKLLFGIERVQTVL